MGEKVKISELRNGLKQMTRKNEFTSLDVLLCKQVCQYEPVPCSQKAASAVTSASDVPGVLPLKVHEDRGKEQTLVSVAWRRKMKRKDS